MMEKQIKKQDELEQSPTGSTSGAACDFIKSMFAAFEEAKIDYCVLRNYENLPYDHGNDLDILISPPDLRQAESILYETAIQQKWLPLTEVRHRYGYHGFYFKSPNVEERYLLIELAKVLHVRGRAYCKGRQKTAAGLRAE